MNPRWFALWGGTIMVLLAICSFFFPGPRFSSDVLPALVVETNYGLFIGLFPMNLISKTVIMLLGLIGIWCVLEDSALSLPRSIWYSRFVCVFMLVLAALGLFSPTHTLFGYWPLFGNQVWSHAVIALVAGFYGFSLTSRVPADRTGSRMPRESLS